MVFLFSKLNLIKVVIIIGSIIRMSCCLIKIQVYNEKILLVILTIEIWVKISSLILILINSSISTLLIWLLLKIWMLDVSFIEFVWIVPRMFSNMALFVTKIAYYIKKGNDFDLFGCDDLELLFVDLIDVLFYSTLSFFESRSSVISSAISSILSNSF